MNLSSFDITDKSFGIRWEKPVWECGEPKLYNIYCQSAGNKPIVVNTTDTKVKIQGTAPITEYRCKVKHTRSLLELNLEFGTFPLGKQFE